MNTTRSPRIDHAFLTDFHIHATAYRHKDLKMTVEGIVRRARELGLVEIGILEHLAPSRGRPLSIIEHIRGECGKLGDTGELRVFRGVEIDVTPEGTFEGPPDVRERLQLDYVIAAVHAPSPGTLDEYVLDDHLRRMLAVLAGPVPFEIMAHPWRSVLEQAARASGRSLSFDVVPRAMQDELITACATKDVAVKVNAGSPIDEAAHDAFLSRALSAGVKLATGSDAHYFDSLDAITKCSAVLERIGATSADVWHPRKKH